MRLLVLDQGMPLGAAAILRDRGWDAVHVRDLGMHQSTDSEILVFAARESRAVVTLNQDFPRMIALMAAQLPSIVLVRQQGLRALEIADSLGSVWIEHEAALEQGCIAEGSARGIRMRLLPLV